MSWKEWETIELLSKEIEYYQDKLVMLEDLKNYLNERDDIHKEIEKQIKYLKERVKYHLK
jgi:hypothetical protein